MGFGTLQTTSLTMLDVVLDFHRERCTVPKLTVLKLNYSGNRLPKLCNDRGRAFVWYKFVWYKGKRRYLGVAGTVEADEKYKRFKIALLENQVLFVQDIGDSKTDDFGIKTEDMLIAELCDEFLKYHESRLRKTDVQNLLGMRPIAVFKEVFKIGFQNCTLHISSSGVEQKPFDKQDGLTYQLGYDYDPSATAPLFTQFLNRVLPDTALQKLIFQYIGYVFLRNMKLDKVLFLYGGVANGKSVFLNVAESR